MAISVMKEVQKVLGDNRTGIWPDHLKKEILTVLRKIKSGEIVMQGRSGFNWTVLAKIVNTKLKEANINPGCLDSVIRKLQVMLQECTDGPKAKSSRHGRRCNQS